MQRQQYHRDYTMRWHTTGWTAVSIQQTYILNSHNSYLSQFDNGIEMSRTGL